MFLFSLLVLHQFSIFLLQTSTVWFYVSCDIHVFWVENQSQTLVRRLFSLPLDVWQYLFCFVCKRKYCIFVFVTSARHRMPTYAPTHMYIFVHVHTCTCTCTWQFVNKRVACTVPTFVLFFVLFFFLIDWWFVFYISFTIMTYQCQNYKIMKTCMFSLDSIHWFTDEIYVSCKCFLTSVSKFVVLRAEIPVYAQPTCAVDLFIDQVPSATAFFRPTKAVLEALISNDREPVLWKSVQISILCRCGNIWKSPLCSWHIPSPKKSLFLRELHICCILPCGTILFYITHAS